MGHHCFATKSTKSSCFCNAFDEIYIQKHKSEGFIEWNLHRRSEWLRGWHTVVVGSCCRLCTCMLWPFAECTVAWNLMLLWKSITCCIACTTLHSLQHTTTTTATALANTLITLHYSYSSTTLRYNYSYNCNYNYNWTTPHYIQQLWVRWPCNHGNHFKKHNSNRLTTFRSISGFALPSEIHNNQPLLLVSYFWNFRHRLVWYYWYIYIFLCMLIWFQ